MWRALGSLFLLAATAHAGGLKLEPRVTAVTSGATTRVVVTVDVPASWHINAHQQADPTIIPTTLTWEQTPGVEWGPVRYPAGKLVKVGWADQPVGLYEGALEFVTEAKLTGKEALQLNGVLRYQACDDKTCFAPATVTVTAAAGMPAAKTDNVLAETVRQRGWAVALLVVFLGGLALNLTPCVYPMITITVSYFGATGGERNLGRAFLAALVYCAGIVLMYSTLGLVAALTGSLFGALLQSPVVLIGIAVLLVALALSLFGLYEIQPPQVLLQRATGLSAKAGFVGVFFLGAMIGIIAAPCLAPFVVALLAFVGQTGNPWVGWWLFFVFACGLGLPYLVLGTFSGLLARLPRSGMWMVWVKRVFGCVLVVVAVLLVQPLFKPGVPLDTGKIEAQLVAAKTAGQPVVLDFFADWCGPCKKMEHETFPDPRVQERLARFAFVKVDLTRTGSPAVEELMRRYDIAGVPTYIFLGSAGKEIAELRQVGFIEAEGFVKLLDAAWAKR
jgi:thiol:disulfide interchange protein DsbD